MIQLVPAALSLILALPIVTVAGHMVAVGQSARSFSTSAIHIQRSDVVRFSNDDTFDHQIYVASPGFTVETPAQIPGATQDIQFTKAGTFDVQCQIHPRMHLAVTVD